MVVKEKIEQLDSEKKYSLDDLMKTELGKSSQSN